NLGRARVAVRGIASTTTHGGSENVLVIHDGVRLNEEIGGGATVVNLDIPLDHVRQVEVLRGPAAAIFGEGALAAVVSLVSQTTADFLGTEANVAFGSFDTQRYGLRSGGVLGAVRISGFIRFGLTDGARRDVPADAQTRADLGRIAHDLPPISVAPGKATDELRSLDAAYAFALREWTFSFRTKSERSDGFIGELDNLGRQNQLNTNQLGLEAKWSRALENLGTLSLRGGFLRSETSDLLEMYPSGYQLEGDFGTIIFGKPGGQGGVFQQMAFNSRRYDVQSTLEKDLKGGHKLTGGLGLRHDSTFDLQANANLDLRTLTPVPAVEGASLVPLEDAIADTSRTTFDLFAEDAWTVNPRLTVTGGLRLDHLTDLGGTLSPRVALVGAFPQGFGWKLLYGRAFRAPNLREQTFDLPSGLANPDLRLVRADEMELALSFTRNRLRLEAHPFLNVLKDTIVLPGLNVPGHVSTFANAEGVHVGGIELLGSGSFGVGNSFFANYTYQNPTQRGTDQRFAGLPKSLFNAGLTLDVRGHASVTPSFVVRSERARDAGDPRPPVPGYAVVNLTARAKNLWRTLDLTVSCDDLFGKSYYDPSPAMGVPGDYPRPGRRVLLHASYKF
ncbi:MAG TPA: TonB-dependent receptor, partial [Vicinamibacteria bacterium]|nr:TonB-dependent receptor [Vicinamibacteria bacterium]